MREVDGLFCACHPPLFYLDLLHSVMKMQEPERDSQKEIWSGHHCQGWFLHWQKPAQQMAVVVLFICYCGGGADDTIWRENS